VVSPVSKRARLEQDGSSPPLVSLVVSHGATKQASPTGGAQQAMKRSSIDTLTPKPCRSSRGATKHTSSTPGAHSHRACLLHSEVLLMPKNFAAKKKKKRRGGVLALSCLIHASCWANAPRWGGRLHCWLAAPPPLPQTWTCCAVQIATRVPLSLYLGPRLVNVVSLAYKILTANHVLIMQ
jgi:hypothetical protein